MRGAVPERTPWHHRRLLIAREGPAPAGALQRAELGGRPNKSGRLRPHGARIQRAVATGVVLCDGAGIRRPLGRPDTLGAATMSPSLHKCQSHRFSFTSACRSCGDGGCPRPRRRRALGWTARRLLEPAFGPRRAPQRWRAPKRALRTMRMIDAPRSSALRVLSAGRVCLSQPQPCCRQPLRRRTARYVSRREWLESRAIAWLCAPRSRAGYAQGQLRPRPQRVPQDGDHDRTKMPSPSGASRSSFSARSCRGWRVRTCPFSEDAGGHGVRHTLKMSHSCVGSAGDLQIPPSSLCRPGRSACRVFPNSHLGVGHRAFALLATSATRAAARADEAIRTGMRARSQHRTRV